MNIRILITEIAIMYCFISDTQAQNHNQTTVFDINDYTVTSKSKILSGNILETKVVKTTADFYSWKSQQELRFQCNGDVSIVKVETVNKANNFCLACIVGGKIQHIANCIEEAEFNKIE